MFFLNHSTLAKNFHFSINNASKRVSYIDVTKCGRIFSSGLAGSPAHSNTGFHNAAVFLFLVPTLYILTLTFALLFSSTVKYYHDSHLNYGCSSVFNSQGSHRVLGPAYYTKILSNQQKDGRVVLAHYVGGFSPWLLGPLASGPMVR